MGTTGKALPLLFLALINGFMLWHFTAAASGTCVGDCSCRSRDLMLDCSRLDLTAIPNDLFNVSVGNFTEVDLSHNRIFTLPTKFFDVFSHITTLNLSDNLLKPQGIQMLEGRMPNLRTLDISRNKLEDFPILTFHSRLRYLDISGNNIRTISSETVEGLKSIRTLLLGNNQLKEDALGSLKELSSLRVLNLDRNPFEYLKKEMFQKMSALQNLSISESSVKIDEDIFVNLSSLRHLVIGNDKMTFLPDLSRCRNLRSLTIVNSKISAIAATFCTSHRKLQRITVTNSQLSSVPDFRGCRNLIAIDLANNNLWHIPADSFAGLRQLQSLNLMDRNRIRTIDSNAFRLLPSLNKMHLSHVTLESFLNLTGTNSLEELFMEHCKLKDVPEHLCERQASLKHIDLDGNEITMLPSFSGCKHLISLSLSSNAIESVDGKLDGLTSLDGLYLNDNKLTRINEKTLSSLTALRKLFLNKNRLNYIHPKAFVALTSLDTLSLEDNRLTSLPVEGLRRLAYITTRGNKDLISFPRHADLPNIRKLTLDYPYHCCYFAQKAILYKDRVPGTDTFDYQWEWDDDKNGLIDSDVDLDLTDGNAINYHEGDIEPFIKHLQNGSDVLVAVWNDTSESVFIPVIKKGEEQMLRSVTCLPQPDEFYPCEDLMGRQWLRVCVWVVFFLALFGNATVLFVISANCSKMDVPRYLIMNLAFADLCLGVYLGFLATVDLLTLGDFRAHALQWQFSSSCKAAGFLAVFASELSVFTLTVITIERFITIKYSLRIEKRIDTRKAVIIMLFGWVLSLALACLPLLKIPLSSGVIQFSDYSKYSVCLPFEVTDRTSLGYVATLILLNVTAFSIIVVCYVKIFLSVRGTDAFNPTDSRVAKRMALLIFTDFACWFPIALITLTAMFNYPLVDDLWVSKVFTVLVFPLNACANPFLYAILTTQFRKDCLSICRRLKDPDGSIRYPAALKFSRSGSKGSNYVPYRRGSSCSFLFSRRGSARPEEVRLQSRSNTTYRTPLNTDDEREHCDRETCL